MEMLRLIGERGRRAVVSRMCWKKEPAYPTLPKGSLQQLVSSGSVSGGGSLPFLGRHLRGNSRRKEAVLVAYGINREGRRVVLHCDLVERGLKSPQLISYLRGLTDMIRGVIGYG